MKIAGRGLRRAGSYYGAKVEPGRTGVYFLLRSDHDVVRRRGLFVRSPEGDFHTQPEVRLRARTDWRGAMFVPSAEDTANDQFQTCSAARR